MNTYCIITEDEKFVKIGKAKCIYKRLIGLQTSIPIKLIVLGYFDTDIEKDLHSKFHEFNVRGEWFDYMLIKEELGKMSMLNYVKVISKPYKMPFNVLPSYPEYPFNGKEIVPNEREIMQPALNMFYFVMSKLEKNSTYIYLIEEDFLLHFNYSSKSKRLYYDAISALISSNILKKKAGFSRCFWVNANIIFNGDRTKIKQDKSHEPK